MRASIRGRWRRSTDSAYSQYFLEKKPRSQVGTCWKRYLEDELPIREEPAREEAQQEAGAVRLRDELDWRVVILALRDRSEEVTALRESGFQRADGAASELGSRERLEEGLEGRLEVGFRWCSEVVVDRAVGPSVELEPGELSRWNVDG